MHHQVGGHHVRIGGDVVTLEFQGELREADFRQLALYLDAHCPGPFFLITLVAQLTNVPAEARRSLSQWDGFRRLRGNPVVGAGDSLLIRTLGQLTFRAIQLYLRRDFPYAFLATEEEAHAWIAELRNQ